ncbi:MAG TPA: hypothetical protein VD907_06530 [Verrucomicrobiae bacterium]|nr:hypothetical protein [Verrucomicrobiae bacterium]
MTESLFRADQTTDYAAKEGGPVIVVAIAFVLALGGLTAAAIFLCGWNRIRNVSINWFNGTATIVCR